MNSCCQFGMPVRSDHLCTVDPFLGRSWCLIQTSFRVRTPTVSLPGGPRNSFSSALGKRHSFVVTKIHPRDPAENQTCSYDFL